jgi:hypothetical protein
MQLARHAVAVGDLFKNAGVHDLNEWRKTRRADNDDEQQDPSR